jgi:triacylglycerol lipase
MKMAKGMFVCLILATSPALAGITKRQVNATSDKPPVASIRNGTYVGRYEPTWNTDYFLGMPYAQPPVGSLRFHVPLPLDSPWTGQRNATEYGPECFGYGLDTESQGNYVSEDCLTLNVVRSRGSGDKLPVLVCYFPKTIHNTRLTCERYGSTVVV